MATKLFVWCARARVVLAISLGMSASCAVAGLGSEPSDDGRTAGESAVVDAGIGESPIAEVGAATQALVLDELPELSVPLGVFFDAALRKPPCNQTTVDAVLSGAGDEAISIGCSLHLRQNAKKRIRLHGAQGSHVAITCDAGVDLEKGLDIRSKLAKDGQPAERVQNVLVAGCTISGGASIGHADIADADTSRTEAYRTLLEEVSPARITFDGVGFVGDPFKRLWDGQFDYDKNRVAKRTSPLYVQRGSRDILIERSSFQRTVPHAGPLLYLAPETRNVVVRNSTFIGRFGGRQTTLRELVALDGSAYDTFESNAFLYAKHGGIFLFRNCGETGYVRYQTPSRNKFLSNFFDYLDAAEAASAKPAIHIGSRNLWGANIKEAYDDWCEDDEKLFEFDDEGERGKVIRVYDDMPPGIHSGNSDRDWARRNAVIDNQVTHRSESEAFVVRRSPEDRIEYNYENVVQGNHQVTSRESRLRACFAYNSGFLSSAISHGATTQVFHSFDDPETACKVVRCNDGVLEPAGSCAPVTKVFSCSVSGNDAGCEGVATCPTHTRVIGAKAACNLEYGSVSNTQLDAVRVGYVDVVKPSDDEASSECKVGYTKLSSGSGAVDGPWKPTEVPFRCRESDQNGGDCHVLGKLYCL